MHLNPACGKYPTDRNPHRGRLTGRTVLQRAAARLPVPATKPTPSSKRRQVAEIRIGDQHDVSPGSAVAAVRPAFRDVLLTAEVQAAVAAAPRLHVNAGAVVEHGLLRAVNFDEALLAAFAERNRSGTRGEDRVVPVPSPGRNFVPR